MPKKVRDFDLAGLKQKNLFWLRGSTNQLRINRSIESFDSLKMKKIALVHLKLRKTDQPATNKSKTAVRKAYVWWILWLIHCMFLPGLAFVVSLSKKKGWFFKCSRIYVNNNYNINRSA